MDLDKLKEKLTKGICLIQFESGNSGNIYKREYTLCESIMEVPNHIKNYQGDNIICYDLEFRKWEDIKPDSIQHWKFYGKEET